MIAIVVCQLRGISECCDHHPFPLRSYRSSHQRDPSFGKVQGFEQHHFRPEPAALKPCEVVLAVVFHWCCSHFGKLSEKAETNRIGMSKTHGP